jgi:hypothetical protein
MLLASRSGRTERWRTGVQRSNHCGAEELEREGTTEGEGVASDCMRGVRERSESSVQPNSERL